MVCSEKEAIAKQPKEKKKPARTVRRDIAPRSGIWTATTMMKEAGGYSYEARKCFRWGWPPLRSTKCFVSPLVVVGAEAGFRERQDSSFCKTTPSSSITGRNDRRQRAICTKTRDTTASHEAGRPAIQPFILSEGGVFLLLVIHSIARPATASPKIRSLLSNIYCHLIFVGPYASPGEPSTPSSSSLRFPP